MTLKEQVRAIVRASTKNRKQEEREKEKLLIRSDEDWEVINEYLENLLKELATKPLTKFRYVPGKYIEIDCTCWSMVNFPRDSQNEFILLKDGTRLEITHEDMQRFCKQHKLKLNYIITSYSDDWRRIFSKKYIENLTKAYLIRV